MAQTLRHPQIIEMARRDGRVTVEGLAGHFGVTFQTIRRDLTELAETGKLERVHGGAVLPSGTENIGYADRQAINTAGKERIARACAALVPQGASLFLNIGTTTELVARQLIGHKDLLIVTNNMNVATILSANPDCEIVLAGGSLRRSDGGLIGPLTVETIRQFKFDLAVIGCSALDGDGDILDFDVQEVGVSRTIIAQSRKVALVADHTKFQRSAPARIGSLRDVDHFMTDEAVPESLQAACAAWGTRIEVC